MSNNPITTKGLADKAMLVNLVISQWLTRIVDKNITRQVATDQSASRDAGTYRKRLLANKGAVAQMQAAVSALRSYHTQMTLPWTKGVGILPSAKYTVYSSKMRELINNFKSAKTKLLLEYPALKEDAKSDLGNMWHDEEYPTVNAIDGKYDVHIDVMPIPKKGDWRVDLTEKELAKLNKELETREKIQTQKAMHDLWDRLYEPIKHLVEVLNKDNPRIFKTLITNISSLTEILPNLNLTEDPKLENLRKEIEDKLCEVSVTELKESPYLRDKIAETAEEIRQKIKTDGEITDDDVLEIMSGYTGNEVIKEFGEPVVGQKKMQLNYDV